MTIAEMLNGAKCAEACVPPGMLGASIIEDVWGVLASGGGGGEGRITEEGERRVTEEGDHRITD